MPKLAANYVKRNWARVGDAGAMQGIRNFMRNKGLKGIQEIQKALSHVPTYTLHRPARKRFKRRALIVNYVDQVWSVDLQSLVQFGSVNSNFKYILSIVDCLSKFAFNVALKNKTADAVLAGLKEVFKRTRRRPRFLWSDQVNENFYGVGV